MRRPGKRDRNSRDHPARRREPRSHPVPPSDRNRHALKHPQADRRSPRADCGRSPEDARIIGSGDSVFATTLRGAKSCCCIVGCGGRIRIGWTPRSENPGLGRPNSVLEWLLGTWATARSPSRPLPYWYLRGNEVCEGGAHDKKELRILKVHSCRFEDCVPNARLI